MYYKYYIIKEIKKKLMKKYFRSVEGGKINAEF